MKIPLKRPGTVPPQEPPAVTALIDVLRDEDREVTRCAPVQRKGRTFWKVVALEYEPRRIRQRYWLYCQFACVVLHGFWLRPAPDGEGAAVCLLVAPPQSKGVSTK